MKYVKGDLIALAKDWEFDVIAHGCNCFNKQKSGIAKQMVAAFGTDTYPREQKTFMNCGDKSKLGTIEARYFSEYSLFVINCYTQYNYGREGVHADYAAIRSCMRAIVNQFEVGSIGLPKIGCGLAGGDWEVVEKIIKEELEDYGWDVTIVEYTA